MKGKIKTAKLIGIAAVIVSTLITGCGERVKKDRLKEIKEAGKIVLATSPDYAPNEFYILDENGNKKIVGSDISLAQAIADRIGVKLEIKATDFSGVLANIQSSEADMAIAGLSWTEDRAKVMQFSDGYLKESENGYQGVLVKKENSEKYSSIEDLKMANVRAGAQSGSIQYEIAKSITEDKNIKQLGTLDALALSLNQGDTDVMVISSDNTRQITATFTDLVMLPEDRFNLDPGDKYSTNAVGFPEGEDYEGLIKVVNEVIAESKANGNLKIWREKAMEDSEKAVE